MLLQARRYDKNKDYQMVCSWWKNHDKAISPADFLSDYGIIASIDGKDIACMWLYPVQSVKFCMIRFPVTSLDSTKEQRDTCLNLCMDTIHELAKTMGYTHMFVTTNTPPFQSRLEKWGYEETAQNCSHYWGGL